jgi:hypothetical protein
MVMSAASLPRAPDRPLTPPALGTSGRPDFYTGFVNGFSHEKSGRLASACGYEVCQVVGADIPADGWARIRKETGGKMAKREATRKQLLKEPDQFITFLRQTDRLRTDPI